MAITELTTSEASVYFKENDFLSSTVLSISYSAEAKTIIFDLAYANITALLQRDVIEELLARGYERKIREFRQLIFSGVDNVSREKYSFIDGSLGIKLPILDLQPSDRDKPTVEYFTTSQSKAKINLQSFGEYFFDFEQLSIRQRFGYAEKSGEMEWQYYDVDTDIEFDFYEPFVDQKS